MESLFQTAIIIYLDFPEGVHSFPAYQQQLFLNVSSLLFFWFVSWREYGDVLCVASLAMQPSCDGCRVSSGGFFLFMTVTIHFSAYLRCTVCCYATGLLSSTELIYAPFCNGFFLVVIFRFVRGPCSFSALTPGSNVEWDAIPEHNEVPVTSFQPATCRAHVCQCLRATLNTMVLCFIFLKGT